MDELHWMKLALRLAKRGYGTTSPNPLVGAVLVKRGRLIGQGWHERAGGPHAEIAAFQDARARGNSPREATLFVTLEPCSTHGRTPPCTDAILHSGIRRVVVGAVDPNPRHRGAGLALLDHAGVSVISGVHGHACSTLNEAFNHWIVQSTPFVTVKAAMTLDGKIATSAGESKWITGEKARAEGMRLRQGADAILVGVNTVRADDPALTYRSARPHDMRAKPLRRIVLDSRAEIPPDARVITDGDAGLTTIVVTESAKQARVTALSERVQVWIAPESRNAGERGRPDLGWLMRKLGADKVLNLLVEGGGEVNASFLFGGWAHRIAFFYAPKVIGGRNARRGIAGDGATDWASVLEIAEAKWKWLGTDLMLSARVVPRTSPIPA